MRKIILFGALILLTSCSSENNSQSSISVQSDNNSIEYNLLESDETFNEDILLSDSLTSETQSSDVTNTITSDTESTQEEIEIIITEEEEIKEVVVPVVNFQDYTAFTSFLKGHVSTTGKVNYAKIKIC